MDLCRCVRYSACSLKASARTCRPPYPSAQRSRLHPMRHDAPTAKNQTADVIQTPRRIENRRPPAAGTTHDAKRVDRTMSTFATTAP